MVKSHPYVIDSILRCSGLIFVTLAGDTLRLIGGTNNALSLLINNSEVFVGTFVCNLRYGNLPLQCCDPL